MPYLDRPDTRLHYVSLGPIDTAEGDRIPFLLIHGLAANLAFWYGRIAQELAQRHRVVMFDLRGHGRSSMPKSGYGCRQMAEDARALLDHLRIGRAHIVGHSFGGNVALQFAWRFPGRIASLTMADVRVRAIQPRVDLQSWRAWPRLRGYLKEAGIEIDESAEDVGFEMFHRIARLRLDPGAADPRSPIVTLSPFAGAGGKAAARLWLKLIESTTARHEILLGAGVTPDEIGEIAAPTLLVYGEDSQTLPTATGLQQILPSSRIELAPGLGHFFPTKRPELLTKPLLSFVVDQHSPSRRDGDDAGLLEAAYV